MLRDRALVIYGPQASGKTSRAKKLAIYFGKSNIVDDWDGKTPLYPEDLALTNLRPEDFNFKYPHRDIETLNVRRYDDTVRHD